MDANEGPNAVQAKRWNGEDGERWARHKAPHDAMLALITKQTLEAIGFTAGQRVLDLGCGSGTTTFGIARLVGPSGSVTGVDISDILLAPALAQAAAEPDLPVTFEKADVETHAFAPESFDVAFSRFGLMFFANPAAAFANVRSAMAPGGRLAFLCWRAVRENTWASTTIRIARNHIELPPGPGPEDPGPYSFRDPARIRRILTEGGWSDLSIEPIDSEAYMGAELEESVANFLTMGPIANQVITASAAKREAIADDLRQAVAELVTEGGVNMQAAAWIVTAAA
jgi:SAM-dependent methyltransferase